MALAVLENFEMISQRLQAVLPLNVVLLTDIEVSLDARFCYLRFPVIATAHNKQSAST